MSARPLDPALREQVRKEISDAYYAARNEGRTMESAADAAVDALAPVLASIDENAHGRGARDLRDAFRREADPSFTGIWREAVDMVDRLAGEQVSS